MISPSPEFIQSLPNKKIPDRKDFEKYFNDNHTRIKNWHTVAQRSHEMAEEFHDLWSSGQLYDQIIGL